MKLELKYLAPYLPFLMKGIDIKEPELIQLVEGLMPSSILTESDELPYGMFKPILRPLEDLFFNLDIENESQKPFEYLEDFADTETEKMFLDIIENQNTKFILEKIQYAPFSFIQKLLEWHFDIFGLIDAKLAVDINCL